MGDWGKWNPPKSKEYRQSLANGWILWSWHAFFFSSFEFSGWDRLRTLARQTCSKLGNEFPRSDFRLPERSPILMPGICVFFLLIPIIQSSSCSAAWDMMATWYWVKPTSAYRGALSDFWTESSVSLVSTLSPSVLAIPATIWLVFKSVQSTTSFKELL